ncbi:glycosyltransferase family 2 protein [Kallotenue papyrolyticum]|uniref:glycosyltransferase family 2 protein n=1 Tax=Kallotenue papyrolyticum TaxID=1325125 RepID=UPI0004785A19|nr:glycosyltransferase family 2 protein [Kallotenue papyrolyticum]
MTVVCSVIVVTYNSATAIDACLGSLVHQQHAPAYEILVVDNASTDDTAALVRTRYPSVRLLRLDDNQGFAAGVNHGVQAARGTTIALLNPDASARADWLSQLIAPLQDARIGVTGSKVLSPDGLIQSVGTLLELPTLLTAHRGDGEPDHGQYDPPADVWAVHGAAMAFRRDAWMTVGGFDEGYFPAYWEESDFCQRVRQAGYRVVTAPQAVVYHQEAATTGKYSAEFYFYYLRNRLRYAVKWLDWPLLWQSFRPAEHARLRRAAPLDRRIAQLVYMAGVPPCRPPNAAQRAAVLATGRELRQAGQPDDLWRAIQEPMAQAVAASIHHETVFHSRWPLIARLRAAWNNIATRWYVRPNLDQQTRYNLAMQRTLQILLDDLLAQAAAQALDSALLAWRLADERDEADASRG